MISNKDALIFLKDLLKLELEMKSKYTALEKNVKEEWLNSAFKRLAGEEQDHADLVEDVMRIFK